MGVSDARISGKRFGFAVVWRANTLAEWPHNKRKFKANGARRTGREKDERALVQVEIAQQRVQLAQLGVRVLLRRGKHVARAHRLVGGKVLLSAVDWRCLFHLLRWVEPVVRHVQPEVEVKRGAAGFGAPDERFRARHDVDGGVECAPVRLARVVGIERARCVDAVRRWQWCARIGALVGPAAQMPLAVVAHLISRLLKKARDGRSLRRQEIRLVLGRVGGPVVVQRRVYGEARRLPTCHETSPGRRADRRCRVKVAEYDALLRPPVEIWRITHRCDVEAHVPPAPVCSVRNKKCGQVLASATGSTMRSRQKRHHSPSARIKMKLGRGVAAEAAQTATARETAMRDIRDTCKWP